MCPGQVGHEELECNAGYYIWGMKLFSIIRDLALIAQKLGKSNLACAAVAVSAKYFSFLLSIVHPIWERLLEWFFVGLEHTTNWCFRTHWAAMPYENVGSTDSS